MDFDENEACRSERSTEACEKKNEIEEMMEDYVTQCRKAMQRGKGGDLPKYLQRELAEQKRERENKALEKATSPAKAPETGTPTPTVTIASAATSTSTIAVASMQAGKEKASEQKKQKTTRFSSSARRFGRRIRHRLDD